MIKDFSHKGLERFFHTGDKRGISPTMAGKLERQLDRLDGAEEPEDMDIPGFGFHELSGNRKGTYSVKVTGNWRLTFTFHQGDAHDVNLEDYH